MEILDPVFLWIASRFTAGVYLTSTKVQGLVWSGADLVLVFIFLRIASLLRAQEGARPIRWRYLLLAATALATPLLAFAETPRQVLLLESAVCGLQFLVLLHTLVRERGRFMSLLLDAGPAQGEKRAPGFVPPGPSSPHR